MKEFQKRIAVVTGGGTGMGRELVKQLAAEGCHVACCDVSAENMAETLAQAQRGAPAGTRITTHVCDVSDEAQVLAFRDAVAAQHATDHVHLLFNNAGIGGGGSLFTDDRAEWERTFAVDWYGVYYGTRAFLPLLVASPEAHIVNTSSVNGFWASLGLDTPHTAYSAAKFAVKGFTRSADLRPAHERAAREGVAGDARPRRHLDHDEHRRRAREAESEGDDGVEDLAPVRERFAKAGFPADAMSDDQLRAAIQFMGEQFRDAAPLSAAGAATIILDGVRNDVWRILVGDDAIELDRMVRATPERAYERSFVEELAAKGFFAVMSRG